MSTVLIQLFVLFAGLSMLAFGGGAGIVPDMQRAAVDHYHWLTAREFLDMFAISRAAPGPGSLIVLLIGGDKGSQSRDIAKAKEMAAQIP